MNSILPLYGNFSLMNFLLLSTILFAIGLCGIVINRKNVITILMSIELMLLAINISFGACSIYLDDITGQVFAIMVLTIAAAEAAIGLAILVVFFRNCGTIDIARINQLKG